MRVHAPLLLAFALGAAAIGLACVTSGAPPDAVAFDASPQTSEVDDRESIPCAPRRVLEGVCQRCHQAPPIRGAPFPLVTRSNILRVGPDGEVRELMIAQLEARRMPLAPETITDESRATLLAWLRAGAPAEDPPSASCEEADGGDAGADAAREARDAGERDAARDAKSADGSADPEDASVN